MKTLYIKSPLDDATVEQLRTGDQVYISGVIYTARDSAHKRIVESMDRNDALPFAGDKVTCPRTSSVGLNRLMKRPESVFRPEAGLSSRPAPII